MKKENPYLCPLCNTVLKSSPGNVIEKEGITLFCPSYQCPAQEVFGYGRNEEAAFEIIKQKYKK